MVPLPHTQQAKTSLQELEGNNSGTVTFSRLQCLVSDRNGKIINGMKKMVEFHYASFL